MGTVHRLSRVEEVVRSFLHGSTLAPYGNLAPGEKGSFHAGSLVHAASSDVEDNLPTGFHSEEGLRF